MSEDKKVVLRIESTFDGKGTKDAEKAYKKLETTADKTNQNIAQGTEKSANSMMTLAAGIDVVKNAFSAVQGVAGWIMECVSAANESARAVNMLAAAYKNVGYTASGAMKQAQDFATKMQSLTGMSDEMFLDAQRQLANFGVVGAQAQQSIQAAYALSVNQGMSFESALQNITRAAAGAGGELAKYGIAVNEASAGGDRLAAIVGQINEKFGAPAQAAMGDSIAKTNALKESWGDLKELIGAGWNEALAPMVDYLAVGVGWLQKLFVAGQHTFDFLFGIIQTGITGLATGIVGVAAAAVKSIKQIVGVAEKLYLVPKGVADAVRSADEFLTQTTKNLASQTATFGKMTRSIKDIWPEEKKLSEEQEKQLELNAALINAKRQLTETAQTAAQQEVEAEREKAAQLAQIRQTEAEEDSQRKAEIKTVEEEEEQNQEAADAEKNDKKKQGREKEKKDTLTSTKELFSNLQSLSASENKKLAEVAKAAGIAQATISTYQGAANALAQVPFPLNFAAMASVLAAGLAQVAQISGVKLADGGLVRAVTGGVPAVVGEGGSDEAVLPLDNARAMRRIGGAIADESGGLAGGATIHVNINASGGLLPFLDQLTEATQNGVTEALRYANVAVKAGNAQGGMSV